MPNSKLVLIITSTFPYGEGEEFFEAEVRGLIASGLSVIILPVWPRGSVRRESADLKHLTLSRYQISLYAFCVTLFRLLYGELRSTNRSRFNLITRCFKESIAAAYAPQLYKMISDLAISHIHAYWSSGPAMLAMSTSRLAKINWSFTGHSGDLVDGVDLKRKAKTTAGIRLISKRAKLILNETVDTTSKPEIIHLGVEVPSSAVTFEKSSCFKIACVGNLIPIKNHDILIKALKIIELEGLNFSIDIIGSGPLENELKKSVTELGLDNYIFFRGQIDHAQLMIEYSEARYQLVVLASGIALSGQQEGIPVSLMEAMSFGIPVVSTETGGIPELVTKELELLVPAGDSKDLAKKMYEIAKMPEAERNALALQCRSRIIENFDVSRTSRSFGKFLHSLMF